MPWDYIRKLLGPGLHWSKSKEQLKQAIARAEADKRPEAVGHLKIILENRNRVMCDKDHD